MPLPVLCATGSCTDKASERLKRQIGTRCSCYSLPWPPEAHTPAFQHPDPQPSSSPDPWATSPPEPVKPPCRGSERRPRSLTLMAVGQEVGAGLQVLPVEAIYGYIWILSHLSLEGTHSAGQRRQSSPQTSLGSSGYFLTSPPLPGSCCRLSIGQPGAAPSNQRSPAAGGGAE